MAIRLIEGLHLTATQKRHMAAIIAKGWTHGHSSRMAYTLTPVDGDPHRYRYHWRKQESDDWGRPTISEGRGIIEYQPGSSRM